MSKRKRDHSEAFPPNDVPPSKKHNQPRNRTAEKLFYSQKLLNRALKVAKGFERQKLAKKRKAAEKDEKQKDIKRLDTEIEAIKVRERDLLLCSFVY